MPNTIKEEFKKVFYDVPFDKSEVPLYEKRLWAWVESKLKEAEENGRLKEWSKHVKP